MTRAWLILSIACVSARAQAIVCPTTMTDCRTTTYVQDCSGDRLALHPHYDPQMLPGGCVCDIDTITNQPSGTACTADSDPCTVDACNGTGQCTHTNTSGGRDCGSACIAAGSCCTNADCAAVANGSGVCSTPGSACTIACATGYSQCGSTCIPNGSCCTNADCPNDPANHRVGVCSSGGCAYTCQSGYKACGATCIASSLCCASSDCTTPSNGCYVAQGTCSSGMCSYAYDNGAACNADDTKCTPNDTCQNGVCQADSAHTVHCVQRECHTAPSCNASTGNCDDAPVANATACGGNGCTAAGTCMGGTCSGTTKDCSSASTDCKAGMCDPSITTGDDCTATNLPNGTACALGDKCKVSVACSGGACVGTSKSCTPSGPCRVSACNSTTGDCDETVAPVGTPCTTDGACTQNATCDATGTCTSDPVPDGTPCEKDGCAIAATCTSGACACLQAPDFGAIAAPDGGVLASGGTGGHGCAVGGDAHAGVVFALFCLLAVALRARSRSI